jgi:hypothetical protein
MAVPAILGFITEARPTEVGKMGPIPKPAAMRPSLTVPDELVVKAIRSDTVVSSEPTVINKTLLTRKTPRRRLDTSRPINNATAKSESVRNA